MYAAMTQLEEALQGELEATESAIEEILTQGSQALLAAMGSVFPDQLVRWFFFVPYWCLKETKIKRLLQHMCCHGVSGEQMQTI